jgi:hypothetical protein
VVRDRFGSGWIPSLFGAIGVGGVALSGVFARAKNTAERLATRMRQDAYTDLVAVAVASVPDYPGTHDRGGRRSTTNKIEAAVRQRELTTATPPPDAS